MSLSGSVARWFCSSSLLGGCHTRGIGIEVHAAASEAQVLRHYTQRFSHLRRESWQEIIHSSPALIFLQKACDDHKNGVWAAGGDPLEGLASPLEDQEIEDVAGDYNHAEPEPEDDGQTA